MQVCTRRAILGRLDGAVVVVTGCGRGFGRGIALALGNEGAKVVGVALEADELASLSRVVSGRGQNILTIPTDLSKPEQIERMKNEALKAYGRVDAVYNNAAVSLWKTMEETEVEEWDLTLDVNLRAYFLVAKGFLPSMKAHKGGSIVNVTSTSAEQGFLAEIAYCPSKYAIEGLTQCMALELRPYNIAVNSLNVSAVEGKQLKPTGLTLEEAERLPESVKGKYVDYDDLANAYAGAWAFLALQRGNGVTGQRFRTRDLAAMLKSDGEESVLKKFKGKLTKATYVPIEFPKVSRYQTPGGGFKEIAYD